MSKNRPFERRSRSGISTAQIGILLLGLNLLSPSASAQTIVPEVKQVVTSLSEAGKLERAARYPEALSKVESAIAEEPDQARPLFLKGIILMNMNRLDDASSVFQQLRERFPELPEPYNNLAVIHMRQGKLESARNALETAILAFPGYATAHENLGSVYARMAADEYSQSLAKNPGNAAARRKLDLIREVLATSASGVSASGQATTELGRR